MRKEFEEVAFPLFTEPTGNRVDDPVHALDVSEYQPQMKATEHFDEAVLDCFCSTFVVRLSGRGSGPR